MYSDAAASDVNYLYVQWRKIVMWILYMCSETEDSDAIYLHVQWRKTVMRIIYM